MPGRFAAVPDGVPTQLLVVEREEAHAVTGAAAHVGHEHVEAAGQEQLDDLVEVAAGLAFGAAVEMDDRGSGPAVDPVMERRDLEAVERPVRRGHRLSSAG